ncbi:MAG TPA: hypothetical protein VII39_13225 [Bradyrhizobium sp.]
MAALSAEELAPRRREYDAKKQIARGLRDSAVYLKTSNSKLRFPKPDFWVWLAKLLTGA